MKYIVKRILQMIPSVLLVLLITFTLSRIVPGDPARMMAGEQAPEEAVERIREEMGLNDPIPKQFVDYVGDVLHGDLGTAWHTGKPVTYDFAMRFPASLELALCALLLAVLIGIPEKGLGGGPRVPGGDASGHQRAGVLAGLHADLPALRQI